MRSLTVIPGQVRTCVIDIGQEVKKQGELFKVNNTGKVQKSTSVTVIPKQGKRQGSRNRLAWLEPSGYDYTTDNMASTGTREKWPV